jgi:hypothetical protein
MSRSRRPTVLVPLTAALLLFMLAAPIQADPHCLPKTTSQPTLIGVPQPFLAQESFWSSHMGSLNTIVGSRKRMVQFGTVAMILALYIIWWRKAV